MFMGDLSHANRWISHHCFIYHSKFFLFSPFPLLRHVLSISELSVMGAADLHPPLYSNRFILNIFAAASLLPSLKTVFYFSLVFTLRLGHGFIFKACMFLNIFFSLSSFINRTSRQADVESSHPCSPKAVMLFLWSRKTRSKSCHGTSAAN